MHLFIGIFKICDPFLQTMQRPFELKSLIKIVVFLLFHILRSDELTRRQIWNSSRSILSFFWFAQKHINFLKISRSIRAEPSRAEPRQELSRVSLFNRNCKLCDTNRKVDVILPPSDAMVVRQMAFTFNKIWREHLSIHRLKLRASKRTA